MEASDVDMVNKNDFQKHSLCCFPQHPLKLWCLRLVELVL